MPREFAPGGSATFSLARYGAGWRSPEENLEAYVREGMTVLEPGSSMGFFKSEVARRVGPNGRVVAVDLQPKMLHGLKRRLQKLGRANRVDAVGFARFPGSR
jgi:ubiquinone/menaquinone biosynthesis C-methylase UbiE